MDTIFALATPRAKSALALLRVSGDDALTIGKKIAQKQLKINQTTLAWLVDDGGKAFDQALISAFQSPKSFTGEDMVEFSLHGSLIIIDQLEQTLLKLGARHAHPGEFTQRAFINQKLNLAKAEAIADIIDAENESALYAALGSLKGNFSDKIEKFVNQLIAIRVEIEAEIDFIDEDIDFASQKQLHQKLKEIYHTIKKDIQEAKSYQKMARGISSALIGSPNVGKSSLMNALLKNQRAIVSDEAGTTRDTLIEKFSFKGLEINLIDTAGIRKSSSKAENLSIERTFEAINQADIVLIVDDLTDPIDQNQALEMRLDELKAKKILWIHNKLDLLEKNSLEKPTVKPIVNPIATRLGAKALFISAKTGKNLHQIEQAIKSIHHTKDLNQSQYLARNRHIAALENAQENLGLALKEIEKEPLLLDLLAEQLRYAHKALEEILGLYTSDELLGEIFGNFCIGK